MKAMILAAGLGSRLRPITDSVPKCMVPVNGIRIIDKQIQNLHEVGISDIFVASGYKATILNEYIKSRYTGIKIVQNIRYSETNNMYSLFLAKEYLKGEDFLLINGDVYFDAGILNGLLSEKGSLIACDNSTYLKESMKVTLEAQRINHISKEIDKANYYAVSIDIYRISALDSRTLFNEIEHIISFEQKENLWTEVAIDRILSKATFRPYMIQHHWVEIDNHEDLAIAERLFSGVFE